MFAVKDKAFNTKLSVLTGWDFDIHHTYCQGRRKPLGRLIVGPVILKACANEKLADAGGRCRSLWLTHAGDASVLEAAKNNPVVTLVMRAKFGR